MPFDEITHLLLVDDHEVVAESIAAYLTARSKQLQVSIALTVPQGLAIADSAPDLDLVLLDLHMPGMSGLDGLRLLRERRPTLPVVILSGEISVAVVRKTLDAGAYGYVPKTLGGNAVLTAVRQVLAGGRYVPEELNAPSPEPGAQRLTPRERQVLERLVLGSSNKEIAAILSVSPAAVALHLTNIYRKLDVGTRSQAIHRAFTLGLCPDRRRA